MRVNIEADHPNSAELGGLRALDFYHRHSAIQASPEVLAQLGLAECFQSTAKASS